MSTTSRRSRRCDPPGMRWQPERTLVEILADVMLDHANSTAEMAEV